MPVSISGGPRDEAFEVALGALISGGFASRLFAKDSTLWGAEAEAEAAVRLGWTDFAAAAERVLAEAEALRAEFAATGIDHIVLSGMGGSSLAPLVITERLTVLDSTHPDAVRSVLSGDLSRTAVVVSSKSGGTIETLSHRASFEAAFAASGIDAASRIVVVTDPGSALEASAREHGQRVFLADPNVGGRFSALTAYGIVPSVLAGADVAAIIRDAGAVRDSLLLDTAENPALVLAASIAAGLPSRFILEVHSPDESLAHLGLWIEQLIAESTGKDGKGIYPISLPSEVSSTGDTSLTVQRVLLVPERHDFGMISNWGIKVAGPLGVHFLLWEVATAALGHLLKIDPFNQPDVEAAKNAARALFGAGGSEVSTAEVPSAAEVIARLSSEAQPEGYLAIQAFVSTADESLDAQLEKLHAALVSRLGLPVSLGFGPRYLHSTGQFHKGGPAVGTFLQLIETAEDDLDIPQSSSTYGELIVAQAEGDAAVLRDRGRTVVTVTTGGMLDFIGELIAEASDSAR